jgi:hypothetical protein
MDIESGIRYLAKNYLLTANDPSEYLGICDHNAQVAKSINKHKISVCWKELGVIFNSSAEEREALESIS